MSHDLLWTQDPSILLRKDRLTEFWPSAGMNNDEVLNSFTRFFILAAASIFLVTKNLNYILLATFLAVLLVFVMKKKEPFQVAPASAEWDPKDRVEWDKNCRKPSKDNPFGNPMPGDPMDAPGACMYKDVKEEVDAKFDESLYKDLGDVFNRANSQRQFYSMPNTKFPNEQTEFANFLFSQGPNCKSSPEVCTGFDFGPKSDVPPLSMEYMM